MFPAAKKRRKMELKMSGQVRTTNYKEIENRAKAPKEENIEKEVKLQKEKDHEDSSEVKIDILKE